MSPPQGFLGPTAFLVFKGLASSAEQHLLGDTNMPAQVFSVKRIPPPHPNPQACPSGSLGGKILGFDPISLKSYHSLHLQATQTAGLRLHLVLCCGRGD